MKVLVTGAGGYIGTVLTEELIKRNHEVVIRYDSFGYEWGVTNPILSERDAGFAKFQNFTSPF